MPLDILAFGAHPDDVELFAGGTLAKMASMGYATGIVDMSRGELGTRGTPEMRAKEAELAASHLGLEVRKNLGLPDGDICVNSESRLRIIRVLREYRPTLVLAHYWEDKHPDHTNSSYLITQAAHHSGLPKIHTGQESFRPKAVIYFKLPAQLPPSFVVDVSDFLEQRESAIHSYKSQLFDPSSTDSATYLSHPEFITGVESLHCYYGTLIGKSKGEGFYARSIFEVTDPVDFFKNQAGSRLG